MDVARFPTSAVVVPYLAAEKFVLCRNQSLYKLIPVVLDSTVVVHVVYQARTSTCAYVGYAGSVRNFRSYRVRVPVCGRRCVVF